MKTTRHILVLIAMVISSAAMAQTDTLTYVLSEIEGTAFITRNRTRIDLKRYDRLQATDRINAAKGTRLTIDCIETKKSYRYDGPCVQTVKQIINDKRASITDLTEVYAKYLVKRSLNMTPQHVKTADGVGYRDLEDSIAAAQDSVACHQDTTACPRRAMPCKCKQDTTVCRQDSIR